MDRTVSSQFDALASAYWAVAALAIGLYAADPVQFGLAFHLFLGFGGVGLGVRFWGPLHARRVTGRRINTGLTYELIEAVDRKLGPALGVATVATMVANLATVFGMLYVSWAERTLLPLVLAAPLAAYVAWSAMAARRKTRRRRP